MCYLELVLDKRPLGRMQRNGAMSALCEFMHGAAKVRWALFPPKAQHQHSGCQLRLGVCSEDHAGVFGAGVAMIDILLDNN